MAIVATKSNTPKMIEFVSVKRASEMLNVSDSRIRQLCGNHERGAIKATRFGKRAWMISTAEIAKYAKKNGIVVDYGPSKS